MSGRRAVSGGLLARPGGTVCKEPAGLSAFAPCLRNNWLVCGFCIIVHSTQLHICTTVILVIVSLCAVAGEDFVQV